MLGESNSNAYGASLLMLLLSDFMATKTVLATGLTELVNRSGALAVFMSTMIMQTNVAWVAADTCRLFVAYVA